MPKPKKRVIMTQDTTAVTTATVHPSQVKVPQKHGGALNGGGTKGNKGGGRTPELVRQLYRDEAAKSVPFLRDVRDGKPVKQHVLVQGVPLEVEVIPETKDRIRAAEVFGKYGLPPEMKVSFDATTPLIVRFEESDGK